MNIGEARDINTVLLWAMRKHRHATNTLVTDEEATEAARRLAHKALKTLMAGLNPYDVTLGQPGGSFADETGDTP